MELAIVTTAIAASLAFASWRVWQTLRVAQGETDAEACGGCSKGCPSEREA